MWSQMSFLAAEENFHAGARHGIDARLYWPGLGEVPVAGTMTGTTLRLEFKAATPQGEIAVSMTGELGPNGLSGKTAVAGLGETDWVGKRVP